jgi:hypothetical protein
MLLVLVLLLLLLHCCADFAMFDVDVTTLDASLVPTQSIRCVIGGDSSWAGPGSAGGYSYITSFGWRSDLNETYTRWGVTYLHA